MLYLCYLCRFKPLRDHLRGFLIAASAGDKIAEFSFPEISFHFSLRPWFFFVSPAYAGKRACTPCCTPVCGDHPRMCGEKRQDRLDYYVPQGSPPRMRGKVPFSIECGFCRGITPAYAGKRGHKVRLQAAGRDHPRVCGEKRVRLAFICGIWGSPPRMRGKAGFLPASSFLTGITPAYAGKSFLRSFSLSLSGDHPRVCGEKARCICSGVGSKGSPPRMRGKGARTHSAAPAAGITPAYAGKRVCLD